MMGTGPGQNGVVGRVGERGVELFQRVVSQSDLAQLDVGQRAGRKIQREAGGVGQRCVNYVVGLPHNMLWPRWILTRNWEVRGGVETIIP